MRRPSRPWTTAPVSDVARDVLNGADARIAPADCTTMAEVRQGVDALDRALVALLAERQGYMDAAARIKTDRHVVRDVARIEAWSPRSRPPPARPASPKPSPNPSGAP